MNISSLDEIVDLTEKASTLELLFQYMYRQPQPDLTEVPFENLAALAEAAEKYRVFAAMEVCKVHMKCAVKLTYGELAEITTTTGLRYSPTQWKSWDMLQNMAILAFVMKRPRKRWARQYPRC